MIKLIRELRQRRVFRGAGYYLLAAWGVLQVGDVIVEPAGLPGWSMTALLYLLVLGFPVAMVLSWRYDIGEHGVVRTKSIGDDTPPEGLGLVDYLLLAGLMAVSGAALYQLLPVAQRAETERAEAAGPMLADLPANTIAVLPFADISQAGDQEFLGDGISDTVMHVLSQIVDLSVTARTSSFAFKDKNLSVTEIAGMLAVAHVLEGSVQRAGDKVRIIARLIDARVGTEVWSGYYDRTVDSIFAIQDEIAREVATALTTEVLKTGETTQVDNSYRPDLEAYEKFILGRQQLGVGSRGSMQEAQALFQEAIDIDPNYAMAHVMLATTLYAGGRVQDRESMLQSASELIATALDIDPQLAEAHGMSALLLNLQKRFPEARAAVDRAIELKPSYAEAYATLASLLYSAGDFEGALAQIRKAIELDPQEDRFRRRLAESLWSVSRAEEAVAMAKEGIKRNPQVPGNYRMLGRWSGQFGNLGHSAYWMRRGSKVSGDERQLAWNECFNLVQFWAFEDAQSCIEAYLQENPDDVEARQYLAVVTRDAKAAIGNLETAIEANPNLWYRRYQLAEWLVVAQRWTDAIELLTPISPELLGDSPKVRDGTVWAAVTLAAAYKGAGQLEKARVLSEAGLAFIDQRRKLQASGFVSGIEDVQFLMLLDREDEALTRLNRSVAAGWRFYSFGVKVDALYDPVRDDPRFLRAYENLEEDLSSQLVWYQTHRDDPIESVGI